MDNRERVREWVRACYENSDIYSDEFTDEFANFNCGTNEITVESEIEYTDWVREFKQPGRSDKVMNVIDMSADNDFVEDSNFGKNTTKTENKMMVTMCTFVMFDIIKNINRTVHMKVQVPK